MGGGTGGNISFKTATQGNTPAERVRINSVGNMGIGGAPLPTTTGYDSATLHLYQSANSGGSSLRMTNGNTGHTTSDGFYMGYWQDGHLYCFNQESGHIIVGTNGSERLRIESDGQVVINRSSGAVLAESVSKLEVYNSTENLIWVANSTAATNQDAGIMFAPANNVYGGKIIVTSDEDFSTGANRTAHMAFYTRKDGSATEKLRITSSGAVNLSTPSSSVAAGLLMFLMVQDYPQVPHPEAPMQLVMVVVVVYG